MMYHACYSLNLPLPRVNITRVPDPVLFNLVSFLGWKEVTALIQTCRAMASRTEDDLLWKTLLKRLVKFKCV